MTYQIETLKKLSKIESDLGINDRIARVIAKGGKIDGKESESMGCIVPHIALNTVNAILADEIGKAWIIEQVEALQDKIIRKYVAAGKMALFDDMIGLGAILAAMMQEEAKTRFSKESIATWFNDDLLPLLQDAIRHKMLGISQDKLDKICAGYLSDFQTLAAREVMISQEVKTKLTKAIALLPDDYDGSMVAEKVLEKLQNAGSKIVEDVL